MRGRLQDVVTEFRENIQSQSGKKAYVYQDSRPRRCLVSREISHVLAIYVSTVARKSVRNYPPKVQGPHVPVGSLREM